MTNPMWYCAAFFDKWLVEQAEKAGAVVVNRIQVTDLLMEGGKVVGIRCGKDTLRADVVVLADGVNSLLAERAGFTCTDYGCRSSRRC